MARRAVLASLVLAAVAGHAWANGRPPAAASITFREGNERDVVIGLTFGLAVSHDGGATWAWMCEDAIGYRGMYDPRYAFTASGALFASTLVGLKVMRDGCTFGATPPGSTFVSTEVLSPDGALFYAASQAADPAHGITADFKIYRSTNDGMTFPTVSQPTTTVNWWQTLMVAPSSAMRLYLSGYRYIPNPTGGGTVRQHLLFRSDNGGTVWMSLPITDFVPLTNNSVIDIVGIDRTDPTHVYARVELDDGMMSDTIYRSTDSGMTWKAIRHKSVQIPAFLARANHDLIIGTQSLGAEISQDNGDSWTPLVAPPHMNCLAENSAGEIWACTQNYGYVTVPSDDAGIMKTTDLITWTKVLRYQDLHEAVTCASGTPQRESCAAMWCTVCQQLGCTPSASYGCPVVPEPGTEVAGPPPAKGGCCDSGAGGGSALALGLVVGTLVLRPRRRRETRCPPT
jgi:photosystem II stability/assembly factor-like uncharacterized protein